MDDVGLNMVIETDRIEVYDRSGGLYEEAKSL
jgi:hypothetical protein